MYVVCFTRYLLHSSMSTYGSSSYIYQSHTVNTRRLFLAGMCMLLSSKTDDKKKARSARQF